MAIAFRSVDARYESATPPYTVTVPKPAGTADGDIMLATVCISNYQTIAGVPSGWTLLGSNTDSGGYQIHLYWHRASSEGSDYTWETSTGGPTGKIASIVCYSGCSAAINPIDALSNTAYTTSNSTIRAASVTTTTANTMLVAMGRALGSSSTPPGGFTERLDGVGGATMVYAADAAQASVGASGDKDTTNSGSTSYKHAFLVALANNDITGTGTLTTASPAMSGIGHYDITGTGTLTVASPALAGVGRYDITGTGALTVAAPALSGRIWLDSHIHRQLTGTAMLNGIRGRVELYGIKGRIEV